MQYPDRADSASTQPTRNHSSTPLNVAIILVVLGMDVFIIQPGFVQGLVDSAGYDPGQAGIIASSEMSGIALATIVMMWLAPRLDWRQLVRVALLGNLLANALSLISVSATQFAVWRFIAGVASGVLISVGYAIAGMTGSPDRSFGWIIMWVLVYGAVGIFVLPQALALTGLHGVLVFLAAAAAAGLFICSRVPANSTDTGSRQQSGPRTSKIMRTLLLGAVLCYFLGQGCLWAYLSLIGVAQGGTDQEVASALTIAQFLGIAGALTAATVGARIAHRTSMVWGIVIGTTPLLLFLGVHGALLYGVAVCVFNFAANFMTPMLTAVVARNDASGKLVVHSVAMQMLGLAVGPAVAAPLIHPGDYSLIVTLGIVLFVLCLALILPPTLAEAHRSSPAAQIVDPDST